MENSPIKLAVDNTGANTVNRSTSLQSAGGGDNSGGMLEARVAKLEADVGHLLREVTDIRGAAQGIGKDMTEVRVKIAGIESDLKHKPGYGAIVAIALTGISFLTAVMILQDKIQHFFGTAPLK